MDETEKRAAALFQIGQKLLAIGLGEKALLSLVARGLHGKKHLGP